MSKVFPMSLAADIFIQALHLSSSGSSQVDKRHLEAPGTCARLPNIDRFVPV